ncbi:MAG: hypothetical protein J1E34_01585 [Oscillospiraceae bacterium]|nr:hypothetical protein [Oscillospiraceae bacterium]
MTGIKRFLSDHRYYFAILAFILLYEWVVVGKLQVWRSDVVAYEFHSLDFSMGFSSFILPGAVYQLICGAPDVGSLSVYHTVLFLGFSIILAGFLERVYLCVAKEHRRIAGVLIFLFLTGPSTFSIFVTDLGMPEVYWVYFAALFFLFLAYKPLNILIAPLCVLSLLVNYAAILCYVPFFCIMILYKLSNEKTKSGKAMLLCTFILCVTVSLSFWTYLVLSSMKNMNYTFEQFNELMRSRGVTELTYTDSLLYGKYEEPYPGWFMELAARFPFYTEGDDLSLVQMFFNFIARRWAMVYSHLAERNPLKILVPLLALFPVIGLVFRFCFSELKNKENAKLRRFVFFCIPALFLFGLAAAWPFSFDAFKWLDFTFLPLFASFLYVVYTEKETVALYIKKAVSMLSFPQIAMYCSVYAVCVLTAYY